MAIFARGGAERPPHDKVSQKSPCKIGLTFLADEHQVMSKMADTIDVSGR